MFRQWFQRWPCYALGVCGAVLINAAASRAGDNDAELRALIEQQQKQIQELKQRLDAVASPAAGQNGAADPAKPNVDESAVKKIVSDYLKESENKKKQDEAAAKQKIEEEGFKVGSDLRITPRWDYHNGVWFETPNKDFTAHLGFRFQEDTVWFRQNRNLTSASQVGDLQDGTFFRRIRPYWEGTFWEVFEFRGELALEQVKQGVPTLDEIYVGMTKIPLLGTIRVGHMRVPQGFEGDQESSSQAMTFLEKAFITDALFQGENFAPGIFVTNSILDQHMTLGAMVYKSEFLNGDNSGADFSDGRVGVSGRMTFLPLYENEGRCLLHLGVSGTWRDSERPNPGTGGVPGVDLRARPELRDAIGDFGGPGISSIASPLGPNLPGNSKRWVDTGFLRTDGTAVLGTELFYVAGPFSVQGEWAFAFVPDVIIAGRPTSDRSFHGGYIQLSYFLTGENRIYDRRLGRLGTYYIDRPFRPFWFVRTEDGRWSTGLGAWEVAARWSYLNLNDGPVQGGVINGIEAALNWYLTNNLKVQFEYMHNNRYDKSASTPNGGVPGNVDALGTRVQFQF